MVTRRREKRRPSRIKPESTRLRVGSLEFLSICRLFVAGTLDRNCIQVRFELARIYSHTRIGKNAYIFFLNLAFRTNIYVGRLISQILNNNNKKYRFKQKNYFFFYIRMINREKNDNSTFVSTSFLRKRKMMRCDSRISGRRNA